MTKTTRMQRRYGMCLSDRLIRHVWAAVTKTPQASCREIAVTLGIGYGTAATAIRFLHDCGYVEVECARGRRIIVPFHAL